MEGVVAEDMKGQTGEKLDDPAPKKCCDVITIELKMMA